MFRNLAVGVRPLRGGALGDLLDDIDDGAGDGRALPRRGVRRARRARRRRLAEDGHSAKARQRAASSSSPESRAVPVPWQLASTSGERVVREDVALWGAQAGERRGAASTSRPELDAVTSTFVMLIVTCETG